MKALVISQSYTNRVGTLEQYLNDISRINLLTIQEEVMLSEKIQKGDRAALDKLVNANLRFVVSVAKKYQHQGMTLEDLISEGNIGLIKAAERFDATRGFKFISFAVWWVRQSMMHALNEKRRIIRLPGNYLIGINNIRNAMSDLELIFGRPATDDELALHLDMPLLKLKEYMMSAGSTVSLDKGIDQDDESGATLLTVVADENTDPADSLLISEGLKSQIRRLLSKLNRREQRIIELFYGLETGIPMELEDIASIIGLSKERVRQLRLIAMKRLKDVAELEMFY